MIAERCFSGVPFGSPRRGFTRVDPRSLGGFTVNRDDTRKMSDRVALISRGLTTDKNRDRHSVVPVAYQIA